MSPESGAALKPLSCGRGGGVRVRPGADYQLSASVRGTSAASCTARARSLPLPLSRATSVATLHRGWRAGDRRPENLAHPQRNRSQRAAAHNGVGCRRSLEQPTERVRSCKLGAATRSRQLPRGCCGSLAELGCKQWECARFGKPLAPGCGRARFAGAIELLLQAGCAVPHASVASSAGRGCLKASPACCAAECAAAWAVILSFPLH